MRSGFAMSIRSIAMFCLLGGAATQLAGCCSANLTLRKCPARIDLRVTTGTPLNSCTDQGSYQVMVRVYSLSSAGAFHAADFDDLWFRESDLGGAVLEVLKLTVEPGDVESHRWQRPAGARAVGVVANFCRLDGGCWKQVVELGDGTQKVELNLAGTCLTLAPRP